MVPFSVFKVNGLFVWPQVETNSIQKKENMLFLPKGVSVQKVESANIEESI